MKVKDLYKNKNFIAHALGTFSGYPYTNSKGALEESVKYGFSLFEVDISRTIDGKFVAIHGFNEKTINSLELNPSDINMSGDEFRNKILLGKSTKGTKTLSLEDIIVFMKRNPQFLFMFDLYDISTYDGIKEFLLTLDNLVDHEMLNRIIIEAYNEEMIKAMNDYKKFTNMMYFIYHKDMREGKFRSLSVLISYLKSNNVKIVSFPWLYAKKSLDEVKQLKRNNFLIFSFTDTDRKSKKMFRKGINVIGINSFALRISFFNKIRVKLGNILGKIKGKRNYIND